MIVKEMPRRWSLSRILKYYAMSSLTLKGNIIDLGSGSEEPSYEKYLNYKYPHKKIYADLFKSGPNIVKIDLEKKFDYLISNQFDFILCHSVLEHIYEYKNALRECYRILKPGGAMIGSVPFLFPFHPCPNDYYRFTHQALTKIFTETGFKNHKILSLGFGPISTGTNQWLHIMPRFIRPLIIIPCIIFDSFILKRIKPQISERYPLGFLFINYK